MTRKEKERREYIRLSRMLLFLFANRTNTRAHTKRMGCLPEQNKCCEMSTLKAEFEIDLHCKSKFKTTIQVWFARIGHFKIVVK